MVEPHEIPQIATELVDMSREYLRQETVEPAKALGKAAGMGIGGALAVGLGSFFLALGLYNALKMWLPTGEWWVVLAKFITALAAARGSGVGGMEDAS